MARLSSYSPLRLTFSLLGACVVTTTAQAEIESLLAPVPGGPIAAVTQTAPKVRWLDSTPSVPAAPTVLEGPALLAELEKQLSAQLSLDGELKLELTRPWPAMKLPGTSFQVSILELPSGGLSPSFYVRIRVTSGGQTLAEGQLPLRAQLWQEVWVTAARIERSQALDRDQLATQKTDVLRISQPLVPATVDPATLETLQALPAGRPLTKRDVVGRPVIRKGQVVDAVAKQGSLQVRLKALAMENGAAGDLIKLRNLESRRELTGQILNDHEVQVHF